jgi:hypothetical protein
MDDKILLDWIKEVNNEFKATRDHVDTKVDDLKESNIRQHGDIMREVAKNREEFVIFKTKVNVRTATISSVIGFFVLAISVGMNIGNIKDRIEKRRVSQAPTEQMDAPKTN